MRRTFALVLLAALTATLFAIGSPPAQAAPAITGRLFDYVARTTIPGATVQLREVDPGGGDPGDIVATTETDATGGFSVVPPEDTAYWVEVVADNRVQHGYADDRDTGPSWLEWEPEHAAPVPPGTALGRVNGVPSFVRGRLVNAANGRPVRGIPVTLRLATDLNRIEGSAVVTNSDGWFRISDIEGEDFGLRFFGRDRGFETGWRACNGTVVRRWGDACASPIGAIGRVRIDRL